MSLNINSNLFFLNTNAIEQYNLILENTLVRSQALIFNPIISSYRDIIAWASGEPIIPLLIQDTSINNISSDKVIYLNNQWQGRLYNYLDLSENTDVSNQTLIFNPAIESYNDMIYFISNDLFINIPSVQDYLLGTIDISFCSGPDGYNSNTVGILLDLNGNQFPIDNSGITYSNDSNSAADVMLYTRNTNEIYVRCKAHSSCNGFYLYSTIFKVIRNPGRERLDIQLLDSSYVNFIPNNNLSSTNVSHAYISVTNIVNYDVSSELQFSGLDSSYNFFVREKYFFIQADARCLSATLYRSRLIKLSTYPQRIGVISLA